VTDATEAVLVGVGVVCGALVSMLTLAGFLWRFAKPWLREQIADPVQVTREHVANSHTSNLRADIDGLVAQLAEVRSIGDDTAKAVARIGGQLDVHLISSAGMEAATNARLAALESRQEQS